MSVLLFLAIRVLHVLLAAVWLGTSVFTTILLMPTMDDSGAAGGQIMAGLQRRGFVPFMAIVGGVTTLTGIYLYWRFTGGFDPAISASRSGMAFGIGGVAGFIAAGVGGRIGGMAKRVNATMGQAMSMPDGAEKASLIQTAVGLRHSMSSSGRIVVLLQVIALVLMSIGHYI